MILGDATGELGPIKNYKDGDGVSRYHNSWYADLSCFISSSTPWFHRGGNYFDGIIAGQFDFNGYTGEVHNVYSSRIVLSP